MDHSFNIDIAKKVGIAGAVLLNNIYWWVDKNAKNQINFYEDKYWTYNKKSAYLEQFPYLTENQLEYALTKLRDAGYIEVGNFNKSKYDRTLWYTLTEKAYDELQNSNSHSGNFRNGKPKNEPPIQDINTNNPLPTVEGERALPEQKKSSYAEILSAENNKYVREALEKFLHYCRGKNYTPKITTVTEFAQVLRDNAGEDPITALAIVDQSIENGWKALYPLKKYRQPKRATAISKPVEGETLERF